ncbi:MAG: hypothetical protein M0Z84_13175 [Gammaproteobacteria bacterium]|nr:hypothetical protein [Gammaproteobacteria bacterium]
MLIPRSARQCGADGTVVDHQLLHGHESRVYGDQTYHKQRERIRAKAPDAEDFTNRPSKMEGDRR